MNIIELSIKSLKPYEKNPRKNDNAVDVVANSIKEFGFKVPIVIDSNNVIVCGHTRYKAAKKLGLKSVPCIIADDLTEEQIKAFRLADNKTAEFAEWDFDLLRDEIDGIFDIDMSNFGFDFNIDSEEEKEIIEDEPPEIDENSETICKLGDIWQLGSHKLLCGDSTDREQVERLMNGEKADMVFTDPPYGINLDTDYSNISGGWSGKISFAKSKKYEKIIGDNTHYDVSHIFRDFGYTKEIFLWGANYFADKLPNLEKSSWFVWDKTGYGQQETVGSEFELLYSRQKHRQIIIPYKWAGVIGLSQQDLKTREHPTQKPLQVLSPIIEKYSKNKDVIVDLFGGSGSTLIACEQLDRKCYMMELSEKYCDVIIKRYEDFTGEKAVKIDETSN